MTYPDYGTVARDSGTIPQTLLTVSRSAAGFNWELCYAARTLGQTESWSVSVYTPIR